MTLDPLRLLCVDDVAAILRTSRGAAAAANLIHLYERRNRQNGARLSSAEGFELYNRWKREIDVATGAFPGHAKGVDRTAVRAAHAIAIRFAGEDRASAWRTSVHSGVGMESGDPALLLRDRLLTARNINQNSTTRGEVFLMCLRSAIASTSGRKLSRLQVLRPTDSFPVFPGDVAKSAA